MSTLIHKGHSRLYVKDATQISDIKSHIKCKDEFEYEYIPEGWITIWTDFPATVYTGKFSDLDMDRLVADLWAEGIQCWVHDAGYE